MFNDSLYRISFKCLIRDERGMVLAVKERGRFSWDLPGGGIDHGETIRACIERELKEEVAYEGDFTYKALMVDEPKKLTTRDVWQVKVILEVQPEAMDFKVGDEADEVTFIDPASLKDSEHEPERRIYGYAAQASSL